MKAFQGEAGKHCVQRIPPTERYGRVHTSTISVAVLPLISEQEFSLDEKDLEMHIARGSGKGGQKRNKTSTAVRLVHNPTGLSAYIDSCSQHQNKKEARRILESKVRAFYEGQRSGAHDDNRLGQLGDRARSGKIRTYNFVRNNCVDHVLKEKLIN